MARFCAEFYVVLAVGGGLPVIVKVELAVVFCATVSGAAAFSTAVAVVRAGKSWVVVVRVCLTAFVFLEQRWACHVEVPAVDLVTIVID
jgi:hypothetical protein